MKYTKKDIPRIQAHDFALSEEARCIADKIHHSLAQMQALQALPLEAYLIDTPEGRITRDLVRVTAGGAKCLADWVTGTLYMDGQCLTSNLRRIVK